MAKQTQAVALVDIPAHGVKAGQILQAEAATLKMHVDNGELDPHKDALAYANSQGAQVVRSTIELAAEAAAAARDALLVKVAELEALLAGATDDATKAAIAAEIDAKRAELRALG